MPVVIPTVQGLAADQVAALRRLCAQSSVALAVIFGSRSRGEATATSDLDILVLPAAAVPFDLLDFEAAAQQLVGRPRVDLTVLHPALSSALAWEALREATVLWEETPGTYERETATWHRRFLEDAPRRREQARQLAQMFRCP
jgi:predicted nucleotidyltransferase